jgi:hypothetical protein
MTLDPSNRRLTLLVLGLMAAVIGVQAAACRGAVAWIPWLTGGVLLPTLGSAWALAPVAVEVDGGELRVVRRMWRPFSVALTEIERVEVAPAVTLTSAVRVFGVGGFFGVYGLLWVRGVGRVRAFLTRRGAGLRVRRRGALPLLLSPDDPDATAAALHLHGVAAADDLAAGGERG